MNINWKKIKEETNPSPKFKENLRALLYEKSIEKEQKEFKKIIEKIPPLHSQLELSFTKKNATIPNIFIHFLKGLRVFKQWIAIIGGGALAMLLIIPLISIVTAPPLSASSQSYIYTFSGDTEISRLTDTIPISNQEEIFVNDIITTREDSQAEIIFFEGSSLRMDKNTSIQIEDLNPQKGIFSKGGVKIHLLEGRIWTQNFHTPSKNSAFLVYTDTLQFFPIRANADISSQGGKDTIRIFKNSGFIQLEGVFMNTELTLEKNQQLTFTPFDKKVIPSSIREKKSSWETSNLMRSTEYKKDYLNRISQQMKEQFVSDEISTQIHTFIARNPSPEEMEDMINQVNTFFIPQPEISPVPTEETPIPDTIITPDNRIEYKAPLKYARPYTKIITPKPSPTPSLLTSVPLVTSSTQQLPTTPPIISTQIKHPQVKTAKEIRKEQERITFQKAAKNFNKQVNTLHFKNSRRKHAQNILDQIPNIPENLPLLKEIEKNAPIDVQRYVVKKQVFIRRSQK